MARIYDIKNKTYHFAGRVNALRKADGAAQLKALGCEAATEASADMIIQGEGGEKKLERVRARGTRVISQQEIMQGLADGGLVELQASDINQIIGELRSLQARTELSDSDRWLLCADLLDRCDEEQLSPVIAYVKDAFVPSVTRKQRWEPTQTRHRLVQGVRQSWPLGCPKKELFVAPPAWVTEMADGTYSPKHELVHALNLDHLLRTVTQLHNVLHNPHLTHVHFLNLGRDSIDPRSMLNKLDACPALKHVEELWLYDFKKSLPDMLSNNAHALKHVRTIVFHGCMLRYNEQVHYCQLDEDEGIEVIEKIQALPCFSKTPHIEFQSIKGR